MLPERELEKTRQDLLELHKRVLTDYLTREGLSYSGRKKFFYIYDHYINWRNIHLYFHSPCKIFVKALIKDKLSLIQGLGPGLIPNKSKKIRHKKHRKIISF